MSAPRLALPPDELSDGAGALVASREARGLFSLVGVLTGAVSSGASSGSFGAEAAAGAGGAAEDAVAKGEAIFLNWLREQKACAQRQCERCERVSGADGACGRVGACGARTDARRPSPA